MLKILLYLAISKLIPIQPEIKRVKSGKTSHSHFSLQSSKLLTKMNKVCRKPPEERAVKYIKFGSYHTKTYPTKISKTESKHTDCPNPNKVKKSQSKVAKKPSQQIAGQNGDNIDHETKDAKIRKREQEFIEAIKNLELENDSLKKSLQTFVSPITHSTLKTEVEESKKNCSQLEQHIQNLQKHKDDLVAEIVKLNEKNEVLQRERDELEDRIELNLDQVAYLSETNEKKDIRLSEMESQIQKLKSDLSLLSSENEKLTLENSKLLSEIADLKNCMEKKDRKIKNKFESFEEKLHNAIQEKEELANKVATDSKYMQLMEIEFNKKNVELCEKNDQLTNQVNEMKKTIERLRHKYDSKKVNKLLTEKDTKYFHHDQFSLYGKSQILANKDRDKIRNYHTDHVSSNNYPGKQKHEKNMEDQLMYEALHRFEWKQRPKSKKN